ncbi:S1 family peptidase [Actinocorallia populi]|uniref:S1 family peptidase n=1 Tax=Actinocorallia populi TaxID=2079200 RepID=UPI000D08A39D|nr:serine protease [Actinocorallia populi]
MRIATPLIALLTLPVVLTAAPASAVVGGTAVKASSYPWLGALHSQAGFFRPGGHLCGGVLVRADKVLTVARCARQFKAVPDRLNVTFGRTDVKKKNGTTYRVKKIWVHPGHRVTDLDGLEVPRNDLAVLTLAKKVKKIKPVKLGSVTGSRGFVLGWGATGEARPNNSRLRKAAVPLVGESECRSAYGDVLDSGMTCAGSGEAAACRFDDGGPLVVRVRTTVRFGGQTEPRMEDRVAGLASWADGCAREGRPGVYTEVSAFRDILEKRL